MKSITKYILAVVAVLLVVPMAQAQNAPALRRNAAKGSESLLQLAGTLQRGLQASCKLREPCKGVGRLPAACRNVTKGAESLPQVAGTLQRGL